MHLSKSQASLVLRHIQQLQQSLQLWCESLRNDIMQHCTPFFCRQQPQVLNHQLLQGSTA